MIHIRDEGEEVKEGFNVYPHGNKHSWGWVYRLGNIIWRVRYSYLRQKWFVTLDWISQRRHDAIVASWS